MPPSYIYVHYICYLCRHFARLDNYLDFTTTVMFARFPKEANAKIFLTQRADANSYLITVRKGANNYTRTELIC